MNRFYCPSCGSEHIYNGTQWSYDVLTWDCSDCFYQWDDEIERDDDTPEEIDAYLRAHGYDPDELVARLREKINPLLDAHKAKSDG